MVAQNRISEQLWEALEKSVNTLEIDTEDIRSAPWCVKTYSAIGGSVDVKNVVTN